MKENADILQGTLALMVLRTVHALVRAVQLGSEYATVVGVMREGFEFPVSHDVWLPLKAAVLDQQPRSGPAISVFALLAPGATMQTAQAELTTAGRRAATELPATHQHLEPRVRPYAMMLVPDSPGDMPIMYAIYSFMIVLVILICGNVGLLLFAAIPRPANRTGLPRRWRLERRHRHARAQHAAGRHARRASPEGGRATRR